MEITSFDIDLHALPQQLTTAALFKSLMLQDNLESEIPWEQPDTFRLYHLPLKLHATATILLCINGEMRFRNGYGETCVKKNGVSIGKSGLSNEVTFISQDFKFVLVVISESFYTPIMDRTELLQFISKIAEDSTCTLPQDKFDECVLLYKMLKNRLLRKEDGVLQEETIKGYLQALTFNVFSEYQTFMRKEKSKIQTYTRQNSLFNHFMELLQNNFVKERNIGFYADKLCITPRYLSRIVHESSGHFASEYIDLFVISEAKQHLQKGKYTILQISEMLNFSSLSIFGRYFKKHTGYSPREFQRLNCTIK